MTSLVRPRFLTGPPFKVATEPSVSSTQLRFDLTKTGNSAAAAKIRDGKQLNIGGNVR